MNNLLYIFLFCVLRIKYVGDRGTALINDIPLEETAEQYTWNDSYFIIYYFITLYHLLGYVVSNEI
jgi:hypothetical protein